MIQAESLRIGNIVNDEDGVPMYIAGLWAANGGKHYNFIDSAGNTGNVATLLSPIPLTPEILEKAGFVDNGQAIFDFDRFTIRIRKGKPASVYYQNVWINDIQNLHTLMNLYFALTHQELTIKL